MKTSESIKTISTALAEFQKTTDNPKNTATNPFFKSKYAPLPDIINHIRENLSKNGLSVFQSTGGDGDGSIYVTTRLLHTSGEFIESDPLYIKLEKNTAQGAGSSITYARRYSLSAILNLSSEEDNDGNHPTQPTAEPKNVPQNEDKPPTNTISEPQRKRMFAIAGENKVSNDEVKAIVEYYGYESSKDILKKDYEKICGQIENFVSIEVIGN